MYAYQRKTTVYDLSIMQLARLSARSTLQQEETLKCIDEKNDIMQKNASPVPKAPCLLAVSNEIDSGQFAKIVSFS